MTDAPDDRRGECSWIDGTAASRYDLTAQNRRIVRERYRHIAEHLSGETVIDLGCAYGIGTNTLAEAGFDATGMDVDEDVVDLARRQYPTPSFVVGDLRDVWFDGHWDNYVVSDVIQHVPDSLDLLARWNDELDDTLVGTTLQRGHENIPEWKLDENPGIVTRAEIEAVFDGVETWQRPGTDVDQRFWFKVER